jgi:predicted metal-dependent phosphoesterase TrpH
MIDLHLHTTASDGQLEPEQLVHRAAAVGLSVIAVTDHDTMAGVAPALRAAAARGVTVVPGIEITSVLDGKDLHVLGYYLDPRAPALAALLQAQQSERAARAREIADALAREGVPIDIEALLATAAARGGSVARPQIAGALVAAGHAPNVADAFERWLGEGRRAFVPHLGRGPAEVVSTIAEAGGTASLAHPGTSARDDIVPALVDVGLAAIEAYHSAHDAAQQAGYVALARRYGLAVTGGSDYHGDGLRRAEFFGVMTLPADEFEQFQNRARQRAFAASNSSLRESHRAGDSA